MKKMENSFVVSGFVGKDASIHQFSTASVARFPLAISRTEATPQKSNMASVPIRLALKILLVKFLIFFIFCCFTVKKLDTLSLLAWLFIFYFYTIL